MKNIQESITDVVEEPILADGGQWKLVLMIMKYNKFNLFIL